MDNTTALSTANHATPSNTQLRLPQLGGRCSSTLGSNGRDGGLSATRDSLLGSVDSRIPIGRDSRVIRREHRHSVPLVELRDAGAGGNSDILGSRELGEQVGRDDSHSAGSVLHTGSDVPVPLRADIQHSEHADSVAGSDMVPSEGANREEMVAGRSSGDDGTVHSVPPNRRSIVPWRWGSTYSDRRRSRVDVAGREGNYRSSERAKLPTRGAGNSANRARSRSGGMVNKKQNTDESRDKMVYRSCSGGMSTAVIWMVMSQPKSRPITARYGLSKLDGDRYSYIDRDSFIREMEQ